MLAEQFAHGYAVLIGVDENSVQAWSLPDVAKDIAALAGVLAHPERCAYPQDNIKTLGGVAATRQGILESLDWLRERIESDVSGNATAVLYYSGHGWRDTTVEPPEYYLIPYDVREDRIRSRALRATDFAEAVNELKPRRLLVILDCCHAGGMGIKGALALPTGYAATALPSALLMGKSLEGGGVKGLEALGQGAGRAVLSSSRGDQPSHIRPDRQMSVFTYHLIEALTGYAQPQEGATEVLVSDVMGHVWRHVPQSARADCAAEQEPEYQVSGNFPVALLLGGKGLGKGQVAPDPLTPPSGPEPSHVTYHVNTGGGDFVGRDQIIQGDSVGGDKVGGDKIQIGAITGGTTVTIGRGSRSTTSPA